jgi:phosphatidylserine/phosphatidylglycerophosphate/cardiolipin synthase-like enzyme
VLYAILAALRRGVDVTIMTSKSLMILEQLVTAGTTTQRCMKKLVKQHKRLIKQYQAGSAPLLEAGHSICPGRLRVSYFHPKGDRSKHIWEPVQTHFKVTIIDEEIIVLGSGNMDRASWYTSQELGVAFFSVVMAMNIRTQLIELMSPRSRDVYDISERSERGVPLSEENWRAAL